MATDQKIDLPESSKISRKTLVAIGMNNTVVAVLFESSTFHMVDLKPNPANPIKPVEFKGVIYCIVCLSTGDLVVCTKSSSGQDVCVVDVSGGIKTTTHFHDKNVLSIAVNRSYDLIYVLYSVGQQCAVDVMLPSGEVIAVKVVTSPAGRKNPSAHCFFTDTGKLAIGIDNNITVYKKNL